VTMTPWLSAGRVGAVLVATCGILSVVAVPDAVARSNYPYCAMSRGADISYQDCSYTTFAACLEEIRGLGGYCRPNARYAPPPPVRRNPPASATATIEVGATSRWGAPPRVGRVRLGFREAAPPEANVRSIAAEPIGDRATASGRRLGRQETTVGRHP
jgi:Protein of unknown function (DUF3551)